jgi:hypothetical protein
MVRQRQLVGVFTVSMLETATVSALMGGAAWVWTFEAQFKLHTRLNRCHLKRRRRSLDRSPRLPDDRRGISRNFIQFDLGQLTRCNENGTIGGL